MAFRWSTEKQEIGARGWWVVGGGREWTEAGGGQNIITINTIFFRRWQKKDEQKLVRWDWWSTEVRWSHLCINEVYRLELGTCVWSLLFSGSSCQGEQGDRSNGTAKDNVREEELKSRGSVFRGKLLNSYLSDIMICRAKWRAGPGPPAHFGANGEVKV